LAELQVAAAKGDDGAQCALGKKIKKEDAAEVVRWFRAAAEKGHAGAQNELGGCLHGRGVDQDFLEAARCRRAADQGHAAAQQKLAIATIEVDASDFAF
jgi:uncharacterized protein